MTEEKIIEELKKLSQLMEREGDLYKATILNNALELIDKERIILRELEEEIKLALESNYKARTAYNPTDEFHMWVQGKIDALRGIEDFIAERKKGADYGGS